MTLRILHAISTLDPENGGPVNALEGLATAQVQLSAAVEILAPQREGESLEIADRLESKGISLTRVGPVKTSLGLHPDLKQAAYEAVSRCDVVHVHALWEDVQHRVARSAQRLNKPYVIRPCGMLDPWSLKQSALRKRIYLMLRLKRNLNRAAAIHFTASLEHELTASLKIQAPPIIEPNGLNLSAYQQLPEPGSFRRICPVVGDRPYLLFLSRIHPKKGLDLLIPAFAQAVKSDYALVIAGPGDVAYVSQVNELVQRYGLSDRVVMPGMLSGRDKLAAYRDAALFCLSSYQENFGNVVIESLACGTPVLISDQVNIYREIVEAGVGRVVKTTVGSVASTLGGYVEALAGQGQAELFDACRGFAFSRYDWSVIANNWLTHYDSLIRLGSGPSA